MAAVLGVLGVKAGYNTVLDSRVDAEATKTPDVEITQTYERSSPNMFSATDRLSKEVARLLGLGEDGANILRSLTLLRLDGMGEMLQTFNGYVAGDYPDSKILKQMGISSGNTTKILPKEADGIKARVKKIQDARDQQPLGRLSPDDLRQNLNAETDAATQARQTNTVNPPSAENRRRNKV